MHVALVGLSGTGKSVVAPLLAQRLGTAHVDIDREVERACGRSVPEVIRSEGEPAFRTLELAALRAALDGPRSVLATGGGLVTTDAARDLLRSLCTVLWLRASAEVLVERLSDGGAVGPDTSGAGTEERPLLAGDPLAALRRQAEVRDPLYRSVAHHAVDVDAMTPDEVAGELASLLERSGGATATGAGRG